MKKLFTLLTFLVLFVTGVTAQSVYCSAGSDYTTYEYIDLVTFNTISNSSVIASSGYSDYSYLSTSVSQGMAYPITINVYSPWSTDACDVWVDWNQDGSFYGVGEHYALTGSSGNAIFSGSIIVPPTASVGTTIMRVMLNDSPPSDPCTNAYYGEVEDYSVVVSAGSGCLANATFSAVSTSAVDWQFSLLVPQASFYNVAWDMGDGWTYNNVDMVSHTYATMGTYTVTCLITDPLDPLCTDMYSMVASPSYCSASSATVDEYIGLFSLNTIFNSSGYSTGYDDYTNISTDLEIGGTYAAYVYNPVAYASDAVGVWIDWNQDYVFSSAGEFYELLSSDGANFYGQVTVPLTALVGPTVLRTRIVYNETLVPCGTSTYGEVEDYSVNITNTGCLANAQFLWDGLAGCDFVFGTSQVYPSSGYSFEWNFDDGTILLGSDLEFHSFASSGYYNVQLTVTDLANPTCYDMASAGISAMCSSGCLVDATFDYFATGMGCEYAFYTNNFYPSSGYYVDWDFGDGTWEYNSDYVYHTFNSSGFYTVTSYVDDLSDPTCFDSYSEGVFIMCSSGCGLDASFSYNVGLNCEYNFFTYAIYPSSGYSVGWDFGDGTTEIGTDYATHTFASSGTYLVQVIVVDIFDQTCFDVADLTIYASCGTVIDPCQMSSYYGAVNDASVPGSTLFPFDVSWWTFNVPAGMTDDVVVSLCGSSYDTKVAVYNDCMDFNGNMPSFFDYEGAILYNDDYCSLQSQVSAPLSAGTYWVAVYGYDTNYGNYSLDIYSSAGCSLDAYFDVVDLGNCDYSFASYAGYASGGYYMDWYVDYSIYAYDVDDILVSFSSSGYYDVSLTVTDPMNTACFDTYSVYIYASCGQACMVDADFTWTELVTYNYDFYTYNVFSANNYDILWNFGDGNTASGADYVNHTFAAAGVYTVGVMVTDLSDPACYDHVSYDVTVLGPPAPWTVNITSTNHTILIPTAAAIDIDGTPISVGDYLGVFFDNNGVAECGGYILYDGTTLALTAWGDDTQTSMKDGFNDAEAFQWKIWQAATNSEYDATAVYSPIGAGFSHEGFFGANGTSGILSLSYSSVQYQYINLPTGWSMFSTYITPFMPNLTDVFATMILPAGQQGNVVIAKDYAGNVFWPMFGLNLIGDISNQQGYQLKLTFAEQLEIAGLQVAPEYTPISLPLGWSIMSYLRSSPAGIDIMLSSIVNDIEIVKNGLGLVYWPAFGVNVIGNMNPGEGYQIKLTSAVSLTYPANAALPTKYVDVAVSTHFRCDVNTGSNMTIGVPETAWSFTPNFGDEIGVYSAGRLIGSGVYSGNNIAITTWGDDITLDQENNLIEGNSVSFKYWNVLTNTETILEISDWDRGGAIYKENAINVVGKFTVPQQSDVVFDLGQNMPNPAASTTTIVVSIPESLNAELSLVNMVGQTIMTVHRGAMSAGTTTFNVDVSNLANGNYMYRLISDKYTATKQMSVSR